MMQDQAEKLASQGNHAAFSPEVVRKIEQRLLWAASVVAEEDEGRVTVAFPPLPRRGGLPAWNRYFVKGLLFGAATTIAIEILRSRGLLSI